MTLSLNERALALVERLVDEAGALGVTTHVLSSGTRVIDCGIEAPGGLEAGRIFAEVCMGGLGQLSFGHLNLDGWWLPAVTVRTDQPRLACMAAQYAGWQVNKENYFAMGSGPARALIRAEEKLYDELGYSDPARVAVLCLEGHVLPPPEIAAYIAERAKVSPEHLTLLIAPTACVVGGVQVAARVVETGLHKLHELGFDLHKILSGIGTCPLPPVAKSDIRAIGRTNDAILYAGQVHYTVRADDAELEQVVSRVPSSTSKDYGAPFYDTFKGYKFDFYQVDPLLFSPAEIFMTNIVSGRTFHAGQVNVDVLKKSFLE
ncbi:MAG: methenyltetrahydromethanopterin cyclohydrolase [Anaerolineae bacterium]|nr:methenyltetrahydromethanopterin cyclohydrolase [Anaerolineales bacterium]MCQ3980270.1 methenyltetrahydromethanopterin cyclohydrolase [Anaerolineae bacterium]